MPPFWARWWFWLYAAAWLPYLGCLLFYGLRSPWWRSRVGQSLMTLYASLVGVLTVVLLVQVAPLPNPVGHLLIAITLGSVAVAGFIQLATILRLQRGRPRLTRRKG